MPETCNWAIDWHALEKEVKNILFFQDKDF